jgi:prepilin-type N-terminal cleavage/methylation domain-containing protein
MKLPFSAKGFTLQELLITMAIIGVLSAIGFTSFHTLTLKSRDQKRKQDLKSISTALELFYQTNRRYPCTAGWQVSNPAGDWIQDTCAVPPSLVPRYINVLPHDIVNTGTQPWLTGQYAYGYFSSGAYGVCPAGTYYFLVTQLETTNDSDSFARKQNTGCTNPTSPLAWPGPESFVIVGDSN